MISLDIESSGLDTGKCGIWQIGALEIENQDNYFLEEAKIDDEDEISSEALKVIGKTEEELRDESKQSQKQLILNFIEWAKKCREKMVIGQNVGFDIMFLQTKCIRYGIFKEFKTVIDHRSLDLHTIAQLKNMFDRGKFMLKDDGRSGMSFTKIIESCGLKDNRIYVKEGEIVKEGTPHNALDDAKLTAECYRRIIAK
jgi:DNA polymerase III epsilon subunit-like protein